VALLLSMLPMHVTTPLRIMDGDRTPRGAGGHHRHLRVEWWALPDLQHCLPRDPPSMFFALMVDALRHPALPPKGLVVDVFYVDGGCS
jgi:hypothetical protein